MRALLVVMILSGAARGSTHHKERYPAVSLFGAHVRETLAWRPLDERGRHRRDEGPRLERLLRCRQTGQQHRVSPRLADALYQIARHFEGHRLEIFSGYRPRAYCDRTQSRHMSGSAVDFHVEGIDNRTLVAWLKRTFHPAGIGFYPNGVHVHLDLERSADTYWVEQEKPLEPAVESPNEDDGPDAVRSPELVPIAEDDPPNEDPGLDATSP